MRTFHIAGILAVVLPFGTIETANAGGIVSYNGGHSIRTASADLLAGPGKNGRKNRGFRFAAPNVVAAAAFSDAGTGALGGTLSLSGGVIKTGIGAFGGTLTVSGSHTVGGTLSLSSGEFYVGRSDGGSGGTVTVGGGLTLVGGNAAGGTLQFRPTSGVVISSGGTINLNVPIDLAINGLTGTLMKVGSGTLTLAGGAGSGLLDTIILGGTFEASQTLEPLVIDLSAGTVVLTNGVAPPAPVEDVSGQSSQPVPEPSAAALLAMSAAALLTRRVRNRK